MLFFVSLAALCISSACRTVEVFLVDATVEHNDIRCGSVSRSFVFS